MSATDGAFYAPPSIWTRIGWRLGYGGAPIPKGYDREPWAEDVLHVDSIVTLSWSDRFRLLVCGKMAHNFAIQCEFSPGRTTSTSSVGILPPKS